MILLIGGEKGGSGKSTLACNLAAYFVLNEQDVLLVDADPQKSTTQWAQRRNNLDNISKIPCVEKTGNIYSTIIDFSKRYKHIIIDTGGRDSNELRSALTVAEIFYTPVKPSQIDIDTLQKMNELAGHAGAMNHKLKSYAIITQAPTNPNMDDAQEAQAILDEVPNFIGSQIQIKYRSSYWRTMGQGLSVLEYNDEKAKNEIINLGKEVFTNG